MDRLKVLMIAPTPFFADRGCHVRIYEESRALQALGCEIVLCTYHIGRDMEGVQTERIINIPWYQKLSAGPSWQKPLLDVLLLLRSINVLRQFKPDIIHAHLHEGAFIARFVKVFGKIPVMFDCQGSMSDEIADHQFIKNDGFMMKAFKRIERYINDKSDFIITSSGGTAEQLVREFNVSKEKIATVTDGVDTGMFKPGYNADDLRDKLGMDHKRKTVVYLGLLNKYQGVDLLLNAIPDVLKKIPDTNFLIMGYPDENKYKEMASRLGIINNVIFTGKIDYSEAPRYLCLGDIAVSAKLSRTEANGKVYNYMAAGLPTVCFDTPVNREILSDLGIYAEFGDKASFASAIIGILSDSARLEYLKSAVRKRAVEELSWERSGERILELYKKAVK